MLTTTKKSDTIQLNASVEFAAAGEGDEPVTFSIAAYNGGVVQADGWNGPVIVDVATMRIPERSISVLRGHDDNRIIGHGTASKTESAVVMEGVVSADNEHSREFVGTGRRGFPWQASVGLSGITPVRIRSGRSTTVNGQTINGPVTVLRDALLDEVSVLPIGADRSSSVSIAASAAKPKGTVAMTKFEKWAGDLGIDLDSLDDDKRADLQRKFEADATADDDGEQGGKAKLGSVDEIFADARRERQRRDDIAELSRKYLEEFPMSADDIEPIVKEAERNKAVSPRDLDVELMRATRAAGINNRPAGGSAAKLSPQVMSAALCQSAGMDTDDLFDEQTNQAAHDAFHGRFGIQQLLLHAANANGGNFAAFHVNPESVVKLAFGGHSARLSGFSTVSAANILADVANKSLETFFLGMDQAWRSIARIVSVRNYQPHHRPSMIADLELLPLSKDGEVEHGVLVDQDRTIAVTDYARMLQLSEVDITNDDLGALTDASRGYAFGASEAINNAFWTAFLASKASFWNATIGNEETGTGSALSSDALQAAHVAIGGTEVTVGLVTKQLHLDGKYLLVPRSLSGTARALMTSEKVVGDTDRPDANIWRGRFEVVEASRLDADSTTAWYLVADPMRIATIEVAFLNGQQVPRVESAACSVESGRYGIASRAKLAFGVKRAHPQGCVRSTGTA